MWYHFEKHVQGYLSDETFQKLDDSITKENALEKAKDWAENVNREGRYAGWETKSNIVECPPDDWVLKEMANHAYSIEYYQNRLRELNEIENPPVTEYGISFFDDIKKERIYLKETYTQSVVQKKTAELREKHQKEYIETKHKKHKYLHRVEKIRSMKYL